MQIPDVPQGISSISSDSDETSGIHNYLDMGSADNANTCAPENRWKVTTNG